MKVLSQSTLLFWLLCFIFGQLILGTSMQAYILGFAAICFLIGCFAFKKLESFNVYLIFAPLFLSLGFLSIEGEFPQTNKALTHGKTIYLGEVQEQIREGEFWSTNIIQLKSLQLANGKWNPIHEKIVLITENNSLLSKHDQLIFQSNLQEITNKNNPGEFNSEMYWHSKGVRYQGFSAIEEQQIIQNMPLNWFEQLLETSFNYSSKMIEHWVSIEHAPMVKAILLGDKTDLTNEIKEAFINTGAMHMLAVSGLHIGLIVLILSIAFKYLFFHRNKKLAQLVIVAILWFYAFLTGFTPSVVRAVMMFTIIILVLFMRKNYNAINSLTIAGFFILLYDPLAIYDIGFQLSFLAMLGIFTLYPSIDSIFNIKQKWLLFLWQGTAIGFAALVFTTPISIYYFHQFPNYFMLSNIAVMLLSGVMLGLTIALLAIGKIPFLSFPIGWMLSISCFLLIGFMNYIAKLPYAIATGFQPGAWWLFSCFIFIFVSLILIERKKVGLILALLIPIIFSLQFKRFQNLSKQEWLIFNTHFPTVLVNGSKQQVCFYAGNERGLKSAKRLVHDYQQIHPGTVEFVPFSFKQQTLKTDNQELLTFVRKKGMIELITPNQQYALVFLENLNLANIPQHIKIISLKENENPLIDYQLNQGAFRVEL